MKCCLRIPMLLPGRLVLRHCIRRSLIRRAECSDHCSDYEFSARHENVTYICVGVPCSFEIRIIIMLLHAAAAARFVCSVDTMAKVFRSLVSIGWYERV